MNIIQPSIEPSSYPFADWLGDAVALVQRVNARLNAGATIPVGLVLCPGRHVLTDHRCLELAGLIDIERL